MKQNQNGRHFEKFREENFTNLALACILEHETRKSARKSSHCVATFHLISLCGHFLHSLALELRIFAFFTPN